MNTYVVKGQISQSSKATKKTRERQVRAGNKGDIYGNPEQFGFSKIHTIKQVREEPMFN